MSEEIFKKYCNKILAYDKYKSFKTTDLSEETKLIPILHEVTNLEAFITYDGLKFLMEYYGKERLTEIIYEKMCTAGAGKIFVDPIKPTKENTMLNILRWIEDLEEEVRDNKDFYKP